MNGSGLILSAPLFATLSSATRDEILTKLGLVVPAIAVATQDAAPEAPLGAALDSEGPAELTVALVRKLTDGLSPKTMSVLRLIAKHDLPEFRMSDAIANTEGAKHYRDMSGVWSALTRRTRAILGEEQVALIWWNDTEYDANGEYVDNLGRVASLTHQSLRAYFNITR